MPSFMQTITQVGAECCSCNPSEEKRPDKSNAAALALLEKEVQDAIMNVVYIPDPDFKEDTESNMISSDSEELERKRRRKRDILSNDSLSNDIGGDSSRENGGGGYKPFPEQLPHRDPTEIMPTYGVLIKEIFVNQSSADSKQNCCST
jgi:hypothetical protein